MSKSHPFSIYLLKEEFTIDNVETALQEDSALESIIATNIPTNAKMFLLDSEPTSPWWKNFFGITRTINQSLKGSILFFPVGNRCFAVTFGHILHHLKDTSYEYDFGLKVTLNSLDPKELKSADMLAPGSAKRKRTQVASSTELTFLDFDSNSEVIKSLTGKVKSEYQHIFKNATGSIALKISLKVTPQEISDICEILLTLYNSEDYLVSFPNIQNVVPEKDPTTTSHLNEILIDEIREKSNDASLSIPDIVDYRDNTCCVFYAEGKYSDVSPNISIDELYDFLDTNNLISNITLENLKKYRMFLTDADGKIGKSFSVFNSLIFETEQPDINHQNDESTSERTETVIYHLCEGKWYKAETDYIQTLTDYINSKCETTELHSYNHDNIDNENGKRTYSEENYNNAVNYPYLCLDQTNISPQGQTQIEPCDIYVVRESSESLQLAHMYHIKISTRSSQLSHLFNQGINSLDLIRVNQVAKENLKNIIISKIGDEDPTDFLEPIDQDNYKVVFGIITRLSPTDGASNLPLFSKMSLMRTMQQLDLRKIPNALCYIPDDSLLKESYEQFPSIIVEVQIDEKNKKVIKPISGQDGYSDQAVIKRCNKDIKEAQEGSRFKIQVKTKEDGTLSSFPKRPYEQVL